MWSRAGEESEPESEPENRCFLEQSESVQMTISTDSCLCFLELPAGDTNKILDEYSAFSVKICYDCA